MSSNPFAEDIIFEWREPTAVRQALFSIGLRRCLCSWPILFPIFAVFGFYLFAIKVWMNGHSLSEASFSGLVLVSVAIAAVLSLNVFGEILGERFSTTTIRLEANRIERLGGSGKAFSCGYNEIKSATLAKHPLAPKVLAIHITTKTGGHVYLGVPNDRIDTVLEILRQKEVCLEPLTPQNVSA